MTFLEAQAEKLLLFITLFSAAAAGANPTVGHNLEEKRARLFKKTQTYSLFEKQRQCSCYFQNWMLQLFVNP